MKAIFYDRNNDLVRCQFAGMNGKGEPDWLMIEQGKPTVTLAETERKENCYLRYRLLCLEGEEVGEQTLLRILCSFIQREIEGWGSMEDDICCILEDSARIEKVYRIVDISSVDEELLSENLLSRFDRIIRYGEGYE